MRISTRLEDWNTSPTIRVVGRSYSRLPASAFNDEPASLRERQASFYRNLIAVALELRDRRIPVDFEDADGVQRYLDRGCIKIAEHAGFIEPLANGPTGVVDIITLSWRV